MALLKHIACLLLCCLIVTRLQAQQPDTKVTLGIKPDYWYTMKGDGVKVKDVIKGQTAEQTGLKAGDIISAFNNKKIKDIFAYRDMLQTFSPGDSVLITVLRNKKSIYFRTRFAKK